MVAPKQITANQQIMENTRNFMECSFGNASLFTVRWFQVSSCRFENRVARFRLGQGCRFPHSSYPPFQSCVRATGGHPEVPLRKTLDCRGVPQHTGNFILLTVRSLPHPFIRISSQGRRPILPPRDAFVSYQVARPHRAARDRFGRHAGRQEQNRGPESILQSPRKEQPPLRFALPNPGNTTLLSGC